MIHGLFGIIESEECDFLSTAAIKSSGVASNGRYVEAATTSKTVLTTTINAQPGVYDFRLSYFDENDGVSQVTVKVEGVAIGSWAWDKDLGSAYASPDTLTSHTIQNIRIDDDPTITIEGYGVRNEPLRLDRVDLLPAGGPKGDTDLASFEGAEGFGSTTAGGRGGWIVKVVNLDDSGVGSLRWALEDLTAPGSSSSTSAASSISRKRSRSDLDRDGMPDSREAAFGFDPSRFDAHGDKDGDGHTNIEEYIGSLIGAPAAGAPVALTVQAESLTLRQGFAVERNAVASGDALIRATSAAEQKAELSFGGAGGTYDMTIGFVDENDGAARLKVLVEGVVVESWTFSRNLGSAYVKGRTLTSRVIDDVDLSPGDVTSLVGVEDGGEPVRIDYIAFTPTDLL